MRISKKHEKEIYDAIFEPIMDLRVRLEGALRKKGTIDIDLELFKLEILINERVVWALRGY